ncbi:probable phosphoglycerate mutase [Proteiniborus ethanoligenes]|uniref:phosphoglycerate mutase (2,3-diphosphoglycerate-dependent) n=1 Tax=Proteiniborus ethanoligenes TaxID=415015 RepID=A0A1H3NCS7_9FIRM|nr:histidine phosphatase family protein [Proteiniborus ethanoligenes]SDY86009.1 probable phosphoglycerate mutase [Proteiniborus ethanoligenes]
MNRLYLLRHGESEWNILNKIQGQKNTNLTDRGIIQAKQAAKRLMHEKIDIIFSSDLNRAFDTAKVIGEFLNLDVNSLKELREISFGVWEGLTTNEIKEKYRNEHIVWMTKPHDLILPNAESLIDLQERLLGIVNNLIKKNSNKNILIVSHGASIKALILGILGIDISMYNKLSISNTGLSIIEYRDYSPVLKLLNDTSHFREV